MTPNEITPEEQPALPSFQGPENLALLFNNGLKNYNKMCLPRFEHISDDDIEHLIKLSYYASVLPEEGRFPRFRFFLTEFNQTPFESLTVIVKFRDSIPLKNVEDIHRSVKDIHRLVPAVSELNYALQVLKVGDELHCTAILLVTDSEVFDLIGIHIPIIHILTGIMVRVDAPGDILVSFSGMMGTSNLRLRAGQIEVGESFVDNDFVKHWIDCASKVFAKHFIDDELAKSTNPGFPHHARRNISDIIKYAWGKILQKAIDARHGGAFFILPETFDFNNDDIKEKVKDNYNIDLKYPTTELHLGMEIVEYWKSCNNDFIKEVKMPQFNPQQWHQRKHLLHSKIKGLANLANVDGCVVLDFHLNVLGFGGEILATDEQADESSLVYAKYHPLLEDRDPIDKQEIMQFGTRNRSAFRFCKVHPGAIAFVVSQDGDLRVFASDASHVFLFKNVTAWTSDRDKT